MVIKIGSGKDAYIYVNKENPSDTIEVRQNDDEKLNESLNEIENEQILYAANNDYRGQYVLQSKKLGAVPKQLQTDERAGVKLEEVS